ncbi:hypothetical protein GGH16_002438 [Coemansia sp. RSA 560]|nr:hypothetical protein GGH16_002438 [Coemansia sp. RSA 560]
MKTYIDLPLLVSAKILAFASDGADGDLDIWKKSLPLLSVCHDWRVQGIPRLYRHAIVEIVNTEYKENSDEEERNHSEDEAVADSGGSDWDWDSSSVSNFNDLVSTDYKITTRVFSNIKLIETLGLGSMVKQLLFGKKQPEDIYKDQGGPRKTFMSVLEAMFHDLPDDKITKPFIKLYELEYMDAVSGNDAQNLCHVASKAAASTLINKYPNVSSINVMVLNPNEYFQKLIADLAIVYDKQLTKLVCKIPPMLPYTLTAPNLVELDLRLESSLHQSLPTIFPQSLQRIHISFDDVQFSWDMFRIGNESKAIVFNSLVDLSITGMDQFSVTGNVVHANDLDLVLPKLERLHLENIILTRKDAQAMMSHGLKRLSYEGSIITASQLCKQPLRDLDTLNLVWVEEEYPEETDDFIPLANEIFNKTDGIEHVRCEIRAADYYWSMVGIDWPYLTHLSLNFAIPFKKLFDMLPKVPNLVFLNMVICYRNANEINEVTEFLTSIQERYPEPSSSKIETLYLTGKFNQPCSYLCRQLLSGRAVENLKWYWPQLKDIKFQD